MKLFYEGCSMSGPEGLSINNGKLSFYHDIRSEKEVEENFELSKKQILKIQKKFNQLEIWDWHKDYDKFHLYPPPTDMYNWDFQAEDKGKKVASKGYQIFPDNFFKLFDFFDKEFGSQFNLKEWEIDDLNFKFKFNYSITFFGEIKIYNKNKSLIYESCCWTKDIPAKRKKLFICDPLIKSFEDFFNKHYLWYLEKDLNKALDIEGYRDGDIWSLKADFTEKKVSSKGQVLKFEGFENLITFLNDKFKTDIMKDIGHQ